MRITEQRMTSDQTEHWAVPADRGTEYGEWWVSWCPDRAWTRNQAISAMTIAELMTGDRDRYWPHIESMAGELGMTASEVLALVSEVAEKSPDES
jgi:hypothetical protein